MNRVIVVIAGVAGLWFLLLASPRSAGEAAVKFAFAAILLLFAYRRFRASPQKAAEYTKHQDGVWQRIEVAPAAAPVNWFAAIGSVVLGASTVGTGMAYFWVLGLLFAAIAGLVLLLDPRGKSAATPSRFRVGPDGIEVGGQLLRKADFHDLRIKNKFGGDVSIVYDASRGVPTGTLVGMAHRRKVSEVAYRIEAEAAGRAYVLAAGLDEVTARGIAAEIGKAMSPEAVAS
ncbi:MAG: hypothetical protein IT489_02985 [Gammaproteobacteria bacterium]|nr:hypothetical protein [Gammaproteobacteria bacterium]